MPEIGSVRIGLVHSWIVCVQLVVDGKLSIGLSNMVPVQATTYPIWMALEQA